MADPVDSGQLLLGVDVLLQRTTRHLAPRMTSGVRASRAMDRHPLPGDREDAVLDNLLDAKAVFLALLGGSLKYYVKGSGLVFNSFLWSQKLTRVGPTQPIETTPNLRK